MIKLKSLLSENTLREYGEYNPSSRIIDKPTFNKLIKTEYNVSIRKPAIYKGIKNLGRLIFTSPSSTFRPSRNTNNFYTTLISVLPSWKDYPKRTRSLICSSNRGSADVFNRDGKGLYRVYPKNGAKIGVCNNYDFWQSFPMVRNRLNMDSMSNFNYHFGNLFDNRDLRYLGFKEDMNEVDMFVFLNNLDGEVDMNYIEINLDIFSECSKIYNDITEYFKTNWTDYFDDLLSPTKNGFELKTIENYDISNEYSREVWTDANSLMVNISTTTSD